MMWGLYLYADGSEGVGVVRGDGITTDGRLHPATAREVLEALYAAYPDSVVGLSSVPVKPTWMGRCPEKLHTGAECGREPEPVAKPHAYVSVSCDGRHVLGEQAEIVVSADNPLVGSAEPAPPVVGRVSFVIERIVPAEDIAALPWRKRDTLVGHLSQMLATFAGSIEEKRTGVRPYRLRISVEPEAEAVTPEKAPAPILAPCGCPVEECRPDPLHVSLGPDLVRRFVSCCLTCGKTFTTETPPMPLPTAPVFGDE